MSKAAHPRILLIGTGDTKADELLFMSDRIAEAGGEAIMMDVSVLGDPPYSPRYDKHAVAAAARTTIAEIASSGDENSAMSLVALGATNLTRGLADADAIDGVIAIGGTMGTDLALDVAQALPLGLPKLVVSTVAFSHLIPPERIAADLMMMLWAGGLYGLNGACKAVLSQACGAIVGAAGSALRLQSGQPVVAITSLGKSCLSYMVELKPQLEKRGYEVVIFHTTGMGGRAMESLAAQRGFAAVLDLSLQEVANELTGSVVNSGPGRLTNAGKAGIPQIVAPGPSTWWTFRPGRKRRTISWIVPIMRITACWRRRPRARRIGAASHARSPRSCRRPRPPLHSSYPPAASSNGTKRTRRCMIRKAWPRSSTRCAPRFASRSNCMRLPSTSTARSSWQPC